MLLSRDEFRNSVFKRDNYTCVVGGCLEKNNLDAHHIIERRLWDDGGYYIDNGATLCSKHHLEAEQTLLSCNLIRQYAKINSIKIPPHFYNDYEYDKWGNIIQADGVRYIGELFYDASVQKILQPVIHLFSRYIKYPKTKHVVWSPGITDDDKVLKSLHEFYNIPIVVTEKMDGENTTLYSDYIHARSLNGKSHPSQSYVRNLHSQIKHEIPEGWRICGENLYAKHSIQYNSLISYFQVFSIWNEKNTCLSWEDTVDWCSLLNLNTTPVLYSGCPSNLSKELYCIENSLDLDKQEGYVLRKADSFHFSEFQNSVVKWVRKNHVDISAHNWAAQPITKNKLKV